MLGNLKVGGKEDAKDSAKYAMCIMVLESTSLGELTFVSIDC